jgi:hypothetical protein
MSWRAVELAEFGEQVEWLSETEAALVYARAASYLSRTHYGLDPSKMVRVERLCADHPNPETEEWLARRVGQDGQRLLLVFDIQEVCVLRTVFFLEQWQNLFCPSRDDVVILPEKGAWVLFYCHEDEFEFGERKSD